MNDDLISEIQTFTLNARAALEDEAAQQLEGIYGWLPDGSFAAPEKYPAIVQIDEARETRRRLEQFAADERAIGVAGKEGRTKLIREIAFTWLNRFVAFRLLEERRLIKEAISRLGDSNAHKLWLADDANQAAYTEYQKGGLPINAMGEGPSDVAYRQFLLWQCREQAKDVSVLFDPETLASRLCPRPLVLKQLVADMNADDLAAAWKIGNEETVGWIYQAFNAEELQAAFAGAREQGKKFEPQDIPAVTQLFTIRWVVRFLVQNTLGRLWLELHPDSRLKDSLDYLVPVEKPQSRAPKLVCEIRFLDPCCGSMHFGLIAFDIFADMYREELERAGQEGWPAEASVSSAEDIPASIVTHNIYGIDLDVRAIQLSALTLLLRARTLNPKCAFTDSNLGSANIEQLTAGRLEEFIQRAHFTHPIYERILKALAARLKDSENLGSLLRLDRDLEKLVADERKKAEADKQFRLAFPALTSEHFTTREGIEEFFEIIGEQIMRHLDSFVKESRKVGQDAGHFVAEAAKGLRFLRIIQHRFDVVTTNPPYLSGGKMNKRLSELLADEYPAGKSNLYAAFVLRCQEVLNKHGLLGMLTMHSFMFISSYEALRAKLTNDVAIETLAHFGGGLFAVGNPGTLQTAAFVLRRETDAQQRDENVGIYFRLVKEPDADTKRRVFETALTAVLDKQNHSSVFKYLQSDYRAIPGEPWAYWATERIRRAFNENPKLSSLSKPWVGLQTSANVRFLRFWWEVGQRLIAFGCKSADEAKLTSLRWIPHMKGGRFQRWYGNQEFVVNWHLDGREMKAFAEELKKRVKSPPGNGPLRNFPFYFKPGITWTHTSSLGLNARILPAGFICNVEAMACYPETQQGVEFVLAVLNSAFATYVTNQLNPTIHYGSTELGHLPLPRTSPEDAERLLELCREAIALERQEATEIETTFDFIKPSNFQMGAGRAADVRKERIASIQLALDQEIFRLYQFDEADQRAVHVENGLSVSQENSEDAIDTEADEPEFPDTGESTAVSWISYAIGVVLGRFAIGKPDALGRGDFAAPIVSSILKLVNVYGIMASDKGHSWDIVKSVLDCLELMLGPEAAHDLIRTATEDEGDPEDLLRGWINGQFWKYHFKLFRKRPVYWPLQSPKKKFTVWVFHERITKDTLFKIRTEFAESKVRWLEGRIREQKDKAKSTTGRESRSAERDASQLADVLDDGQEFAQRLNAIIQRGYVPHIDDGGLLNAAPLWELLPSWPETKKAWQELDAGKYDWAQQAMEYWPERVKETCKTNKSFAIAHGLA